MNRRLFALALAGMTLTGCGKSDAPPPAAEPPATTAPAVNPASPPSSDPAASGPVLDTTAAQALLTPDETLQSIALADGNPATVSGEVVGYKTTAWAVMVGQGQTLSVTFKPASSNLYMNIQDTADTTGTAVHRGETDGPTASLVAARDSTYLIRPFQPRAMARREEKGTYSLEVSVR
ncbi:hypothetical protein HNQ60_002645 [Povalibacter uvarum]|uniref:Uncharacterized protein n=1 Tax=Povalibacter uvarum TaxID=732238 RepID=A0A841HMD6_9GAMM|nr:hypothetical protein [Povalibacter uvarum]MBB6093764.1 hypothetical protein [Povalibacter uvarum]